MSESKEKPVAKKLPCGGYAIFTKDFKSKQLVQTGYVGPNLELTAYLPKDAIIQK
jgi:hypothetical protein